MARYIAADRDSESAFTLQGSSSVCEIVSLQNAHKNANTDRQIERGFLKN